MSRPITWDPNVVQQVIGRFETPLYLYDASRLDERCQRLTALGTSYGRRFVPCYMVKANFAPPVLSRIVNSELGVVVTSEFELELCLRAGASPNRITVVGPAKSRRLIDRSLRLPVRRVVVESPEEARALSIRARALEVEKASIGLRVRVNVPAHVRTSFIGREDGGAKKFGVSEEELSGVAALIGGLGNLELDCLSTNLGSQICSPNVYFKAWARMVDLAGLLQTEGLSIRCINLGGGLPVAGVMRRFSTPHGLMSKAVTGRDRWHQYEVPTTFCEPEMVVEGVLGSVRGLDFQLLLEPGRWVVSDCLNMVARVERVVKRKSKTWLFVNVGIDLLPDVGFGQKRDIQVIGAHLDAQARKSYAIAGPLCQKGDVLSTSVELPTGIRGGDHLVIAATGAYGFSRTSWFGGMLPRIVEVCASGFREVWSPPSLVDIMFQDAPMNILNNTEE